jgi:type IV secretory pathway VirB6-like protein
MRKLSLLMTLFIALWGTVLLPQQAVAQEFQFLYCNTNNGTVAGGAFYESRPGMGACTYTGLEHVFSQVMCRFVTILNDVLGKMYCGMQYGLKEVLAAALTLYVVIFGAQLLMGTAQLRTGEIMVRLLKIAGVWTFATQSSWAINLTFNFFLTFASQGIWWAFAAIHPEGLTVDPSTGIMPVYAYLDELLFNAVIGPFTEANAELITFFAIMSYVMPPLFMIAIYWLWTTFTILVRTLISFMMGIAALAFLISLSPIFLSFMLFQATYQFFENWLRYIMSYTLQIIIVFACIGLWLLLVIPMLSFFNELAGVVFPYQKADTPATSIVSGNNSLGVCPYRFTSSPRPHVRCERNNFDPINPADKAKLIDITNISKSADPQNQAVKLGLADLIYFVIYHMISLILICYAFDALLKQSPNIARQLAGPQYVPILGQGWGETGFNAMRGGANKLIKPAQSVEEKKQSILNRESGNMAGKAIGDLLKQSSRQVTRRKT